MFELSTFKKYVELRVDSANVIYPYFSYLAFFDSWIGDSNNRFFLYEDFKNKPLIQLKKLCHSYGYEISENKLLNVISEFDFKNITNRKPGTSNSNSHKRKGIVGDWRNHFDSELNEYVYRNWERIFPHLGYKYEK
jgi:hypothetical protein